jgi:glutamate-ammonia-ligase adenylyltransferase
MPGSDAERERAVFDRVMERLREDLARHTVEGTAYRVDLRLRPYGSSGPLVTAIDSLVEYYQAAAGLWEVQALLKARPVAGSLEVGELFVQRARPVLLRPWPGARIADSIERLRSQALLALARATPDEYDVKSGLGGIRDLEFMIQGLQLAHASRCPEVLAGNTLEALERLEAHGVLSAEESRVMGEDYTLLRRVEHALQVLNDQQRHRLPTQPEELRALARRVLGPESGEADLRARLDECQVRVRSRYDETLRRLRSL